MSVVVIGGGPRPQAQVSTVNGVVIISDENGVIASGFSSEEEAHRYLKSYNHVDETPHEDEHHDVTTEA